MKFPVMKLFELKLNLQSKVEELGENGKSPFRK